MKKFEQDYKYLYKQKVEEVKLLGKALELACERLRPFEIIDNGFAISVYAIMDKYILQAKKEMEE